MKKISLLVAVILMTGMSSAFWNWDDLDLGEQGQAAVIEMDGQIMPSGGEFDSGLITPEKVEELNEEAVNQGADAIIYEWNSGGGAVVASKEVKSKIESAEVPTVCRFRDISASGAYLASLGCDQIVADSMSMTGSIGVSGSFFEFSELLDEYGVDYVNVTAGEHKEVGSPFQNTTEQDLEILEDLTDNVHAEFLETVQEDRNISDSDMEEIGTGRIILGFEAEEKGMVDTLGGQETAIQEAENLTGQELTTFKVETEEPFDLFQFFGIETGLNQFIESESFLMARFG